MGYGQLYENGTPVAIADRWIHSKDRTECVAGRVWCEHHGRWECAMNHDDVEPMTNTTTVREWLG